MKYRNQPTGMWGKQQAKDEDSRCPRPLRLNTQSRSLRAQTQRCTHLKTNLTCVPSFIHLVFLPRNELGINSTFLQTKNFK